MISSGRKGKRGISQITGVQPLHDQDAGVLAQAPVELPVTDVDRDHHRRSALEQAVGEAAGRGADVEAATPVDVDLELGESVLELDPASRDELFGLVDDQLSVLRDQLARLLDGGSVLPQAHPAGADARGGGRTRGSESALGEQGVGAAAGHAANRT